MVIRTMNITITQILIIIHQRIEVHIVWKYIDDHENDDYYTFLFLHINSEAFDALQYSLCSVQIVPYLWGKMVAGFLVQRRKM